MNNNTLFSSFFNFGNKNNDNININTPLHVLVLSPDRPFEGMGGLSVQLKEMVEGCVELCPWLTFSVIGPSMHSSMSPWPIMNQTKNFNQEQNQEQVEIKSQNLISPTTLSNTLSTLSSIPPMPLSPPPPPPSIRYYNCYQRPRMTGLNTSDIWNVITDESNYLLTVMLYNIVPDVLLCFDFSTCSLGWMLKDYYQQKHNKIVPFIFGCSLSYGKWYSDTMQFYKQPFDSTVQFVISKEQRSMFFCDALLCNSSWWKSYFPPFKTVFEIANGIHMVEVDKLTLLSDQDIEQQIKSNYHWLDIINKNNNQSPVSTLSTVSSLSSLSPVSTILPSPLLDSKININENLNNTSNTLNTLNTSKRLKILYIGRLVANKGVQFLLHSQSIPTESDIYFMGDLNGVAVHIKQLLKTIIEKDHRFHYVGKMSGNKKMAFIKSMDCCVFPAIHEPFGIVMLEAAACGVPFFYSTIPGMEEIGSKLGGYPLDIITKNPDQIPVYIGQQLEQFRIKSKQEVEKDQHYLLQQVQQFNWKEICNQYVNMFYQIRNNVQS